VLHLDILARAPTRLTIVRPNPLDPRSDDEQVPSAEEITRHHDDDSDEDPWVNGRPPTRPVEIVPYDSNWPLRFDAFARAIRDALGQIALAVEHVGSTSVPGLAAKDVIDIDLTVPDPRVEAQYVPALERVGWVLTIREPSWHEHRCLTRKEGARSNLHVFGPDCPEVIRHRMFRDWLIAHDDDRELYEAAKRAAIPGGGDVTDYNARKQVVIRDIYDRVFRAAGLL
jgi:GrpB-like predicted nucleotidyltransferase (UPF0157 family)